MFFFSSLRIAAFVVEVSFAIGSGDIVYLNSYIFRWFSVSANGWQENCWITSARIQDVKAAARG